MIMVTHNPDLECYANRILYIHNGFIEKQVLNTRQCQYYPEEYQEKVNSKKLLYSLCCYLRFHHSSVERREKSLLETRPISSSIETVSFSYSVEMIS